MLVSPLIVRAHPPHSNADRIQALDTIRATPQDHECLNVNASAHVRVFAFVLLQHRHITVRRPGLGSPSSYAGNNPTLDKRH